MSKSQEVMYIKLKLFGCSFVHLGDEESPRKRKKRKQHKAHRVTEGRLKVSVM